MRDKTLEYSKKYVETAKNDIQNDFRKRGNNMVDSLNVFLKYLKDGRNMRCSTISTSSDQKEEIDRFIENFSECIRKIDYLLAQYNNKIDSSYLYNESQIKMNLEIEFFIELDVLIMFFIEMV